MDDGIPLFPNALDSGWALPFHPKHGFPFDHHRGLSHPDKARGLVTTVHYPYRRGAWSSDGLRDIRVPGPAG